MTQQKYGHENLRDSVKGWLPPHILCHQKTAFSGRTEQSPDRRKTEQNETNIEQPLNNH
jgi:hypothetical protein